VLIGPDELGALPALFPKQQFSLLWDVPLQLGSLTAAHVPQALGALAALKVSRAVAAAGAGYLSPLAVGASPENILAPFPAQEAAADQVLSLTITGLFLIGLVLILLAARLIVERRDEELAAMRARGSSLRGLALRILADTGPLLIASPAAGIAPAVAISPGGSVIASWEMTAVLGAAALAAPPLLAIRCYPLPLRAGAPVGRPAPRRGRLPGAGPGRDRLVRIYTVEGIEIQALQGLDLAIRPGELTALVGASGSGKSTLLTILSGLDRPTAGHVTVAGHDLLLMKGKERLDYRRQTVGFIWQQTGRNLLSYLTAAENVALPMRLTGTEPARRDERAMLLLRMVGRGEHAHQRAYELSGGQQQRVAIARALANRPRLLIADEPTGQLDTQNARQIMRLLRALADSEGVTVLVATHDRAVLASADRTLRISDGVVSETAQSLPAP
jgi:ABC-type lipoprotein export system ATPase subunit